MNLLSAVKMLCEDNDIFVVDCYDCELFSLSMGESYLDVPFNYRELNVYSIHAQGYGHIRIEVI